MIRQLQERLKARQLADRFLLIVVVAVDGKQQVATRNSSLKQDIVDGRKRRAVACVLQRGSRRDRAASRTGAKIKEQGNSTYLLMVLKVMTAVETADARSLAIGATGTAITPTSRPRSNTSAPAD